MSDNLFISHIEISNVVISNNLACLVFKAFSHSLSTVFSCFRSSLFYAIAIVLSAYIKLLVFLPPILNRPPLMKIYHGITWHTMVFRYITWYYMEYMVNCGRLCFSINYDKNKDKDIFIGNSTHYAFSKRTHVTVNNHKNPSMIAFIDSWY